MISKERFQKELDIIINNAIREDIGEEDHSGAASIDGAVSGKAKLLVKEDGILAGVDAAEKIFNKIDPELVMEKHIQDGQRIVHGDIAFFVSGKSRSILKAERVMLNTMQRMSAIATKTRKFAEVMKDTRAMILDTRKTTPGFRAMEKWAVKIGGGTNHRFGLYDMIMLKDNHIDFCGGIDKAIEKTLAYLKKNDLNLKIVAEARSLQEVDEILEYDKAIERILLDNFSYANTQKAVEKIGSRCKTESSGGITLKTAQKYAECGVDFISSGALTHSVKNLDLSLKAV